MQQEPLFYKQFLSGLPLGFTIPFSLSPYALKRYGRDAILAMFACVHVCPHGWGCTKCCQQYQGRASRCSNSTTIRQWLQFEDISISVQRLFFTFLFGGYHLEYRPIIKPLCQNYVCVNPSHWSIRVMGEGSHSRGINFEEELALFSNYCKHGVDCTICCITWSGFYDTRGSTKYHAYPAFATIKMRQASSVWYYLLFKHKGLKKSPSSRVVHTCGNTQCINIAHIYLEQLDYGQILSSGRRAQRQKEKLIDDDDIVLSRNDIALVTKYFRSKGDADLRKPPQKHFSIRGKR